MGTNISKLCADFLRVCYPSVKATHAHELVAAFFGYKSHASELAEQAYKLERLRDAELLIPAISRMEQRRARLEGLPDLPPSRVIAERLVEFLRQEKLFDGQVWLVDDLGKHFIEEYLPDNFALDVALGTEIAGTNAIFDDICYECAEVQDRPDDLTVMVKGLYSGQTIDDKPYCGDQIDFTVIIELARVAGRTAFWQPDISAHGTVRDWQEYEPADRTPATIRNFERVDQSGVQDRGMRTAVMSRTQKATPVNLHRIPKWIESVLMKEYPYAHPRKDYRSKRDSLEGLLHGIRLDHWGTTEWYGIKHCFVTEPYGVDQNSVSELKEKGRRLGFAVVYDPISFHNPGGCERVLIFPTDLSPTRKYDPAVLAALREAGCAVENGSVKPRRMEIIRGTSEDKEAFADAMKGIGRTAHDFFDRSVAVERSGEQFIFHCLKQSVPHLNRTLSKSKKWAKEVRRLHPDVVIRPIEDNQLISDGDGLFTSNDGYYIGAFEQKYIPVKYIDRVEKIFSTKLEQKAKKIVRSESNQFDERHLFIELEEPMTAKAFRELYAQLKPELDKVPDAGHCGTDLRKTSSWQSISEFMKENLVQ
ncbi:MAG: hypothetical protein HY986_11600 [Candidatus Melainabacteria bacterium]|nr:hypothetical protein [Candidatus Melainabacteria bacterium]